MEFTMRHLLAGILTLVLFSDAIAQTAAHPSPELSRRALRKQDRQVCTAQAVQENVARRNQAEFLRYCVADRQGKRRAATRRGLEGPISGPGGLWFLIGLSPLYPRKRTCLPQADVRLGQKRT